MAMSFLIVKLTPFVISTLGIYGLFCVFGIVVTCTGIFAFFFMPETTGLTLIEIQKMYEMGALKNKKDKDEDIMNVSSAFDLHAKNKKPNLDKQKNFSADGITNHGIATESEIMESKLEAIRVTHPEEWTGGRKRTLSTT